MQKGGIHVSGIQDLGKFQVLGLDRNLDKLEKVAVQAGNSQCLVHLLFVRFH